MYDCENEWCARCKWTWSDAPVCLDCEAEHTTKMPSGYEPITNYDRIRGMTVEELAEILHNAGGNWYTVEYWTKWLKATAEEE